MDRNVGVSEIVNKLSLFLLVYGDGFCIFYIESGFIFYKTGFNLSQQCKNFDSVDKKHSLL